MVVSLGAWNAQRLAHARSLRTDCILHVFYEPASSSSTVWTSLEC